MIPWLTLWFAFQVGIVPNSEIVTYSPFTQQVLYPITGYTELAVETRFWHIGFIGGFVRTEIQPREVTNWLLGLSSYGFTLGARYEGLEIGWNHVCQHPTLPYWDKYHPVINWDATYNEVYLKISGEVGF